MTTARIAVAIPLNVDPLCKKIKYSIKVNGTDRDQNVIVNVPTSEFILTITSYLVSSTPTYFAASDILIITIKQGVAYTSNSTVTYSTSTLTVNYTIPGGYAVVTKPSNPTVTYASTIVKNQSTLALSVTFAISDIDPNATHYTYRYGINGLTPKLAVPTGTYLPISNVLGFNLVIDRTNPDITAANILQAGMTIVLYLTVVTANGDGTYKVGDEVLLTDSPTTLAIPATPAPPTPAANGSVTPATVTI